MREGVATGERSPKASPAMRRSAAPGRRIFGSEAAAWWWKAGSASSCSPGSATQDWMPNMRRALLRRSGSPRSECTMPRPEVIQLTSPGTIGCTTPRLSRCTISPSNSQVTVASPTCGCGRTSTFCSGAAVRGPIWSKKMNGPTIWWGWPGSTRLTIRPPPRSRSWDLRISISGGDLGQFTALVVADRLLDFFARVHHEGAVLHDRLPDRLRREHEEARAVRAGLHLDRVARAEHRALVRFQRAVLDLDGSFERIHVHGLVRELLDENFIRLQSHIPVDGVGAAALNRPARVLEFSGNHL